jgi:hypothetical protein
MIVISALRVPALVGVRERLAGGKLLAHALEDQDVGVDRHADREHDAGQAGQRHRGADARHGAEDDQRLIASVPTATRPPVV